MIAKIEDRADTAASANLPASILVVDDDEINLMVIEQMLEISGYSVVSAVDGVDAVEKAALTRPTLILMDISMPRMNGIEAAITRASVTEMQRRSGTATAEPTLTAPGSAVTSGASPRQARPLRQRRTASRPPPPAPIPHRAA